jgi:fatty acid amide hydrolase
MTNREANSASAAPSSASEITHWGAAEIARRIAAGQCCSVEVVEAFIARIRAVDGKLNAVVVPLFDQARADAKAADERQRRGKPLGPLHGVPVTIKESFFVAGTPSSIGLTHRKNELAKEDGVLVRRLRRAGAIVLGKTNLTQLMIWHESDNPVYGRTNNPWDLQRTSGGSTGGEGAIIAAGGSPLGLASDLGGSIRVPSHFCGICGIKPTSMRLPRRGAARNLRGMETLQSQPGPMARRVEDLYLALRVLADPLDEPVDADVAPAPLPDPANVKIEGLRVAMWTDDGCFAASPAIRRAVEEAAAALRARGAIVELFQPPDVDEALDVYFALLGADGGRDARRLLQGSEIDSRMRELLNVALIPNLLRGALSALLRSRGQRWRARLVSVARARSADEYWQLTQRKQSYVKRFMEDLEAGGYDAMLAPPHALPAMQHGHGIRLLPAASYAYFMNLLGVPCGVVAATRVRHAEESDRPLTRDLAEQTARQVEIGSAGLPVGVQVAARHWREDIVLALMKALEEAFQGRPDYPQMPEI